MVKCTKSQVRKLKTALRWKIPAAERERHRGYPIAGSLPIWRRDENGPRSLRITKKTEAPEARVSS